MNLSEAIKRVTSQTSPHQGSLGSWRLAYFGLALFNVLTLAAGLLLNQNIGAIFTQSSQTTERWVRHTAAVDSLPNLAHAIHSPGNRAMQTLNPRPEREALEAAVNEFLAGLTRVEKDLNHGSNAPEITHALSSLEVVHVQTLKMAGEARVLLDLVAEGKYPEAVGKIPVLDQQMNEILAEVTIVRRMLSEGHARELQDLILQERRIERFQWLSTAAVVPLVAGLTIFGRRMNNTMSKSATERERLISELVKMRHELEHRVKERTADLEASESHYRDLVTALPGTVFQLAVAPDGSLSFRFVSEGIHALTGLEASVVRQQPSKLFELIEARDRRVLEKALAGQGSWRQSFQVVTADGERRWVKGQATPMKHEKGGTSWHGVLIDISEQKEAEERLTAWGVELEQRVRARTLEIETANRRLEVEVRHRIRMQEKVMQVTMFQRTILDAAGYAIIATDEDGLIRTFNAAAQQMLGYDMEEVLGKITPMSVHLQEEVTARSRTVEAESGLVPANDFDALTYFARLGLPDEKEWTYVRRDGSHIPVLLSITALTNNEGAITGFVGIAQDITERKRIERELRQLTEDLEQRVLARTSELSIANKALLNSEAELKNSLSLINATLESTADGILVVSPTGTVEGWNRQFLELWHMDRDHPPLTHENQLSELASTLLLAPEQFSQLVERLKEAAGSDSFDIIEFKDGRVFERHSKPRKLENTVSGRVWSFRDITDRRKAETHLEEANRRLVDASREAGMAEIATSVLHNVGNVLNSVNVSATLISDTLRNSKALNLTKAAELLVSQQDSLPTFLTQDPKGRQLPGYLALLGVRLRDENTALRTELNSLAQNIDHIKQIVAMQQSYAKVSGVREALQLNKMIEDAIHMSMGANEQEQIRIVREFQEVPVVYADKHKTLQILINLIRNAKYALHEKGGEDPTLTLRLRMTPGHLAQIEVADNGIGISPENMSKLFRHGFTTKRTGHGFGLHGSALAIREMGGSLKATSDGPGLGATFTVELPVTAVNEPQKNA